MTGRFTITVGASSTEHRLFRGIANRSDPESRLQINARGGLECCWAFTGPYLRPGGCASAAVGVERRRRGPPIDTGRSRQPCLTPIEARKKRDATSRLRKRGKSPGLSFPSSSSISDLHVRELAAIRCAHVGHNAVGNAAEINNSGASARRIGATWRMSVDWPHSSVNRGTYVRFLRHFK